MSERDLLLYLLLEENEEEEIILQQLNERKAEVHSIFRRRHEKVSAQRLSMGTRYKIFRQFFRINSAQFNYILDLIKDGLKKGNSSRYMYPIRQI